MGRPVDALEMQLENGCGVLGEAIWLESCFAEE